MFTQNVIELSAAVHELFAHREKTHENNTVRRYRADSKNWAVETFQMSIFRKFSNIVYA